MAIKEDRMAVLSIGTSLNICNIYINISNMCRQFTTITERWFAIFR